MQTLSLRQARQSLGKYARRALRGEDVGLVVDGQIVALRPVEVYSEDYALTEYGVTCEQVGRVVRRIDKETQEARRAGKLREFTGKL
jgi:antitoxin (DNA-binding transcriptional repressor) of toxin-antitoxin stability system